MPELPEELWWKLLKDDLMMMKAKTCMLLEVSRIGKMKKCPMTPASTSCLRAIDELHKIECASAELALGPRRVN